MCNQRHNVYDVTQWKITREQLLILPHFNYIFICLQFLVRDSSAVRRLFVRLAGAVGHQSALHKENSGFAAPTLGWLPRFVAIGFIFYPKPLYKSLHQSFFYSFITILPTESGVYNSWLLHNCHLDPLISPCIMGDDLHIWSYLVQNERGRT